MAECLAIALANKPSLRAAGAAVDAARYRVRQAASQYLPQIGATHDVQRRKTSLGVSTGTDLGMGGGSGFDPGPREFTFYSTGVSLSQTLFDFGRNLAEIRAAQARRRSAEADRDTELEVVVFEVKQSYFNLLAAQRLAGVAEQTVRQNRTLLEEADARYEVGMAARFDQTRARVQLATTELDQLTSRNNVALARETLRNALGLDGPLDFEISDTLEVTEVEVDEAQALAVAYAQRPELRSFDEQRAAVAQTIVALQRDYLPALAGNGSYNWSGSDELQES
ncbi:MAG TPA: TolC family protein, partial [Terriglobales bacterium]|nr:TolC family protein [Terriglobales bacterium]